MTKLYLHPERQLVSRLGWLGAGVLDAKAGIGPTADSILCVVAAAQAPDRRNRRALRAGIVLSGTIETPPTRRLS
ncbi:hypothetical protein [Sphingomonas sp. UYP23]